MTSRREFLRIGAVGSVLVLGLRPRGKTFRITKQAARFTPSVWLAIDERGSTMVSIGKQEMGQGVRTSLAMILADELDADWSRVELVQAEPGPDFTRLGTGGSWSIGGSWRPLRQAGAAARAMLVSAAARRWGVDPSSCRTASGTVSHPASGRTAAYGDLVAEAALLPVPSAPALKAAADRRLVGTRMKRLDGPQIVRGAARYGIDTRVPGMLFASLLRPPVMGAALAGVDQAAALRVSGVRQVVQLSGGVAVVADSTWAALKGRRALIARWAESPHRTFDSENHWRALEAALQQPGVLTRQEGNVDPSLSGAGVLEATYRYPFEAHAPVEPMNCVAHVRDGGCDLWVPTQAPNRVQTRVAGLLGLPETSVRVHPTLIGGGFGRRLGVDYALEAAELSKAIGAPVQLLWTREDDIRHGHFQNASVHHMRGALDGAGRGAAWRHKKASSLHNLDGPPTAEELRDPVAYFQDSSWGVYDIPYAFPAIETAYVRVDIPVRIGPWRAVYSPSSTFARECFMDEMAHAAGQDPLAFRLSMLEGPDIVKAGGLSIDRARLRRVLELVRSRSGWDTPIVAGRGRGVACNVYDGETHVAYVAEVSVPPYAAGGYLPFTVHRMVCAIDCGVVINPLGIEQQVEGAVVWASRISRARSPSGVVRRCRAATSTSRWPAWARRPSIEVHIVPSHGDQPSASVSRRSHRPCPRSSTPSLPRRASASGSCRCAPPILI
jgi:isoquinoline 1-oxidoreductase beta subunit